MRYFDKLVGPRAPLPETIENREEDRVVVDDMMPISKEVPSICTMMMLLLLMVMIMNMEILTRLKRPILLLCQTAASPLWDRYENANANNNVNDGDNV